MKPSEPIGAGGVGAIVGIVFAAMLGSAAVALVAAGVAEDAGRAAHPVAAPTQCVQLPDYDPSWEERLSLDTTFSRAMLSAANFDDATVARSAYAFQATSEDHVVSRIFAIDDTGCSLGSMPIAYDVWDITLSVVRQLRGAPAPVAPTAAVTG